MDVARPNRKIRLVRSEDRAAMPGGGALHPRTRFHGRESEGDEAFCRDGTQIKKTRTNTLATSRIWCRYMAQPGPWLRPRGRGKDPRKALSSRLAKLHLPEQYCKAGFFVSVPVFGVHRTMVEEPTCFSTVSVAVAPSSRGQRCRWRCGDAQGPIPPNSVHCLPRGGASRGPLVHSP